MGHGSVVKDARSVVMAKTNDVTRLLISAFISCSCSVAFAADIKLQNFSAFDDRPLSTALKKALPLDMLVGLSRGKYALFVLSSAVKADDGFSCVAITGVTHSVAVGKSPRIPEHRYSGFVVKGGDANQCMAEAILLAAESMAESGKWENLAKAADLKTATGGVPRPIEKVPGRFSVRWHGEAKSEVAVNVAKKTNFGDVFDYRHLEIVGISVSAIIGNKVLCYALAGASPPPPESRNSHYPGFTKDYFRWVPLDKSKGTSEESYREACESEAVEACSCSARCAMRRSFTTPAANIPITARFAKPAWLSPTKGLGANDARL